MANKSSTISMIAELWAKLQHKRRQQFIGLLFLMVLASLAEVLSIGAVFPFLGIIASPDQALKIPGIRLFSEAFKLTSASDLLLSVMIFFILAVIISGAVRLILLYANNRYSYAVGADMSLDIYRRTLYQPYAVHISRNSSEIINAISGKTAMVIGSILVPVMALISASILFFGVLLAILAINAGIAIGISLIFGVIYYFILRFTRSTLQKNSESIARESNQVIKSLQEGLGGIRDVLLDGTQEVYCKIYERADLSLRLAQGDNSFISASPRYLIEMIGMVLVACLAFYLNQQSNKNGGELVIPVLGALALGAQRLLPVLQQGYSSLAIIRGAKASLNDVLSMLNQPLPHQLNMASPALATFDKNIILQNIGFRYGVDSKYVLSKVNLEILKGQRIGFIGITGSGKSTLLDIVMGLLIPTEGSLMVDGRSINLTNIRSWQAQIAHVPQGIYLADSSIEENIAFGIPIEDIDHNKVKLVAAQAQISDVIESWPLQYKTKIGERGIRLSGGQRQRIGIARALYKQAKVIIFDEATSALDSNTEKTVMEAVDKLHKDLTVLIIAHRLTTLKNCDLIVELEDGMIKRVGPYSSLVNI
ncbi:ABC transporter ATP-binding protein [Polynucleobacter paneuropaeus]|nr:ABC transporter ATP-binding protein [Polynucleobacter paneuropaeus]